MKAATLGFKFYILQFSYRVEMIMTLQKVIDTTEMEKSFFSRETLFQMLLCHILNSLKEPLSWILTNLFVYIFLKNCPTFSHTINPGIFLITECPLPLNVWTFHDFNSNNIYLVYISSLGEKWGLLPNKNNK